MSVLLAAVLVVGRLLWCFVAAIRARQYRILIVSAVGMIGMIAALGTVALVWFSYGVAHAEKNTKTDLIVLFSTAPPFFLVSLGLWLLGGKLLSRLRSRSAPHDSQRGGGSAVT